MFSFLKNVSKGVSFDNKVKAQYGIEMVQWLHEAYDTQVKQGIVPKNVSYADYAPVMLEAMKNDVEAKERDERPSEKYYHTEGKTVTKKQERYTDHLMGVCKLEQENPAFFSLLHTVSKLLTDHSAGTVVQAILEVANKRTYSSLVNDLVVAKQVNTHLEELANIDGASEDTILDERASRYITACIERTLNK